MADLLFFRMPIKKVDLKKQMKRFYYEPLFISPFRSGEIGGASGVTYGQSLRR